MSILSLEFQKRLRKLIADCNDVVNGYRNREYTYQEAIGKLQALEEKVYKNDPNAEPDGDYTYTVAVAMEELQRIHNIRRPLERTKELREKLVALVSLSEALIEKRPIKVEIEWHNGVKDKSYTATNIEYLNTFIAKEREIIMDELESLRFADANQ